MPGSTKADSTVAVRGAGYRIPGGRRLYRNLSFEVGAGQVVCVLGPNGVGKTTLINCLCGLRRWTEGETRIGGAPLKNLTQQQIWKTLGYVPQARTNAFSYTVLDMVLLGMATQIRLFATPGKEHRERAMTVLQRLEIDHLARRACNQISGGELQLTFIARALVNDPKVLVLDEPESHLDFKKQLIILELVASLAHQDGISCIMNTHFPNNALRIADRILLLGHGGWHTFGPARETLTAAEVARYFEVNAQFTTVQSEHGEWPALHPVSLIPSEEEVDA